ncbi:MAG: hypothetical protein U1E39_06790 [Planctomycetota bacterium]
MVAALVGAGLLGAFVAFEAWGERLGGRRARWPLLGYALLLLLAGVELARNDHGFADVVFPIAFVAAPVLVIFGGSAAGVRRFYGWPDLGPTPGRLAAVASALLVGVLVGTRVREADVEVSMARGRDVALALAGRHEGTGVWPARLEDLFPDPPRTRLGWIAPPPFTWDPATARLAFAVSSRHAFELDVRAPKAPWKQVTR